MDTSLSLKENGQKSYPQNNKQWPVCPYTVCTAGSESAAKNPLDWSIHWFPDVLIGDRSP